MNTKRYRKGDRVRLKKASLEFDLPKHAKGTIVNVTPYDFYSYDVKFDADGDDYYPAPVDEREIEYVHWWDRWFPARDAERHFGTEATVAALNSVKGVHAQKVTIEGE